MNSSSEGARRVHSLWPLAIACVVVAALSGHSLQLSGIAPSLPRAQPVASACPVLAAPRDERHFAWRALPSGLLTLAVSDASLPTSGAAVSVSVGALSDPPSASGLAHFAEHLVFLGSAAFPGESEYGAYLSANGGASNAFTSLEETRYFFGVRAGAMEGALARFAGFFSSPLFSSNATERERNAVDSEHAKNLQSDGWRVFQLLRHMATEGSPWHGFGTGTADTLGGPLIRPRLLALHAAHYCAPHMRLVLVGPQDTTTLLQWAEDAFGGVPRLCVDWREGDSAFAAMDRLRGSSKGSSTALPSSLSLLSAFPEAVQQRAIADVLTAAERVLASSPSLAYPLRSGMRGEGLVVMSPIADVHELSLLFPVHPQSTTAEAARVGAADFIASALGDERAGGLLAALRAAGLASSISAGLDAEGGGITLLSVTFTLSPALVAAASAAGEGANQSAAALASDGGAGTDGGRGSELERQDVLLAGVARIQTALYAYLDLLEESLATEVAPAGASPPLRGLRVPGAAGQESGPTYRGSEALPPQLHFSGSGELVTRPPLTLVGRLWEERVLSASLAFAFPTSTAADTLASALAGAMQARGPADILSPPSRQVWQPEAVLHTVRALGPDTALSLLITSLAPSTWELNLTHTEPIYGTAYALLPRVPLISGREWAWRGAGTPILHLPLPNAFIPPAALVQSWMGASVPLPWVMAGDAPALPPMRGGGASSEAWAMHSPDPVLLSMPPGPFADITRVWWAPDRFFGHPRVHVALSLASEACAVNATAVALNGLFAATANEAARDVRYAAGLAGATVIVSVGGSVPGLELTVGGYISSISPLIAEVLPLFLPSLEGGRCSLPPALTPSAVASKLLELGLEAAAAIAAEQPYVVAKRALAIATGEERTGLPAQLAALRALAGEEGSQTPFGPRVVRDLSALHAVLTHHVCGVFAAPGALQVLAHGALSSEDAAQHAQALLQPLATAVSAVAASQSASRPPREPWSRPVAAPVGRTVVRAPPANADDANSAAFATWEIGRRRSCGRTAAQCADRAAAAAVLGRVLYEPFFTALRTRQQLGYIVSAGLRSVHTAVAEEEGDALCGTVRSCAPAPDGTCAWTDNPVPLCPRGDAVLSLYAVVQGPGHPALVLDERIQSFAGGPREAGTSSSGWGWVDADGMPADALQWGEEGSPAAAGGVPALLAALSPKDVTAIASALLASTLAPPASPAAAFSALWAQVAAQTWDWGREAREAAALGRVTVAAVARAHGEAVASSVERRLVGRVDSAGARAVAPGLDSPLPEYERR